MDYVVHAHLTVLKAARWSPPLPAGVLALMNANPSTQDLPIAAKTMVASNAAATWRIFLMPIDTVKTIMQVEGASRPAAAPGEDRVLVVLVQNSIAGGKP